MQNNNLLKYILFFLFFILIFQSFYYYPKLPDTIASNYNAAGEPNGWMSKNIFYFTIISIYLFIIILLLVLPYIVNKLPLSIVSFPNKYLWFNKSIYEKTKYKIIDMFDIFNIGLLIFFIYTNQLTIIANLKNTNLDLKYFFPGFVIFMLFTILWIVMIYYKFSKKNYLVFVKNIYFDNEKIDKDEMLNLLGNLKAKLISNNIKINKKEYNFDDLKDIFLKLK